MKIGVILVNLYVRAAQRTVAPGGGGLENALSSAIAGDQIAQRSGIPVWNIPDACGRCKTGLRSGEPDRFSSRGTKTDDARPANSSSSRSCWSPDTQNPRVLVRVFPTVIPCSLENGGQIGPHQFHRLDNRIDCRLILTRDPIFGFKAE